MTVMVDECCVWPHAKHRCFKAGSAHLTADTTLELHAFARKLRLRLEWFRPLSHPHYDLTPARHARALELGAVLVTAREQSLSRRDEASLLAERSDDKAKKRVAARAKANEANT